MITRSAAVVGCLALLAVAADHVYQTGHTRDILFVGWSSDSKRVLSYSWADSAIRLWDTETGRVLAVFDAGALAATPTINSDVGIAASKPEKNTFEFRDEISKAVLWRFAANRDQSRSTSPDGRIVAEGGRYGDACVKLIDANTNQLIRRLEGHPGVVYAISFAPDGRSVASANGDRTVVIRDAQSGAITRIFGGHSAPVRSVAFSPDGNLLASAGEDKAARIWNVRTGESAGVLHGHSRDVTVLAFSPDGRRIATGSDDMTIRLWDVHSAQLLRAMETPGEHHGPGPEGVQLSWCCGSAIRSLAFSPSGQVLASGGEDGSVLLWDVASGKLLRTNKSRTPVELRAIHFAAEGRWLAAASKDDSTTIRTSSGRESLKIRGEEAEYVQTLTFSSDGRLLATGAIGGEVGIWEARTGRRVRVIETPDAILTVAFSPDSRFIAAGGEDQTVRVWETHTGKLLWDAAAVTLAPK